MNLWPSTAGLPPKIPYSDNRNLATLRVVDSVLNHSAVVSASHGIQASSAGEPTVSVQIPVHASKTAVCVEAADSASLYTEQPVPIQCDTPVIVFSSHQCCEVVKSYSNHPRWERFWCQSAEESDTCPRWLLCHVCDVIFMLPLTSGGIMFCVTYLQGSDTRVRTQKNPVDFFWYTHLKKTHPKKPTLLL